MAPTERGASVVTDPGTIRNDHVHDRAPPGRRRVAHRRERDLASDGSTVIEFDDDNGSFAGLSSSIAGAVLPSAGTYFIRVNDLTAGTASERPYEHFRLQSGAPTPEVESNDTPATANVLPASGWVSGARNPGWRPSRTGTASR
jgi:hypothetical protein